MRSQGHGSREDQTILTDRERRRYARHLLLPEVGLAGQLLLKRASILIVGAGGLCSPAAMYLTAAGVGRVGIVDDDAVELSNLQRQILYRDVDQTRPKVDVAVEALSLLNPEIVLRKYHLRANIENIDSLIKSYDIVLDCTDNFETRYLLSDACVDQRKPLVSGSVSRFEGHVVVLCAQGAPCYRCIFPTPPTGELAANCAEAGVLGVLPGIVGAIQACEALKILLGIGDPLMGRLLILDALGMRLREGVAPPQEGCRACGEVRYPRERLGISTSGCDASIFGQLGALQYLSLLESGHEIKVIDVRELEEWKYGHIERSICVPLSGIDAIRTVADFGDSLLLVCKSGVRSQKARKRLVEIGYSSVQSLQGGMVEWNKVTLQTIPLL